MGKNEEISLRFFLIAHWLVEVMMNWFFTFLKRLFSLGEGEQHRGSTIRFKDVEKKRIEEDRY